MPTSAYLPVTILLPAIGAAVLWIKDSSDRALSSRVKDREYALYATLLTFLVSTLLLVNFDHLTTLPFVGSQAPLNHTVTSTDSGAGHKGILVDIGWKSIISLSFTLGIDSLSLWMILLTTFLFPVCVLVCWQNPRLNSKEIMSMLLILETMLIALWSVQDLLCFYILYESVLFPLFYIIGYGGSRERKIRAAYLLVLYTFIGSLFMLPCVLAIYSEAGTTDLELLIHTDFSLSRQKILWWGLFLAFAVKIPMIPFHIWLPEAHVEAPTAGSVLLAGVMLKLGGYGYIRYSQTILYDACVFYSPFCITISLIAIIYASLTTLRQVDLKKLIAYSSVAHMGLVTAGIFSLNYTSSQAAIFIMLCHGLVSPALFILVGALYDRYHTKLLKHYGGFSQTMPIFSVFFFLFTLANMAIPLFPNFIAEFLALCGVFRSHFWAALLMCIGIILSAVYSLWAYARVVHGIPSAYINAVCDLNRREFWILLPIFVVTMWLGICPTFLLSSIEQTFLI